MINDAMIEVAAVAYLQEKGAHSQSIRAALTTALPLILAAAAQTGYRTCAETRHVTLGRKVDAAIRAMGEKTP